MRRKRNREAEDDTSYERILSILGTVSTGAFVEDEENTIRLGMMGAGDDSQGSEDERVVSIADEDPISRANIRRRI
ncbi:MAG: hypothetical protein AB7F64_07575 [Gammaproteobacteria bacterium]